MLTEIDGRVGDVDPSEDYPDDDEFDRCLLDTMTTLVCTLMEKNERYGGAYRELRKLCRDKYGDPTVPLFIHTMEKQMRMDANGDNEDARKDFVGYVLLEYVCQKLDG